ncbi:hypothetical protein BCR32DRAFT_265840 [Anaeromyces robustus]|uniref:NAD(P)-binding domain-containing protein n=1 Tax=Anaeromyces robustus TaxID=1754192 RepID=A0A1Y1XHG7_9FUNG|nr:hypothetical protein BCR32DRAFT_265840 [Anaeromyces robustus]|eukprot:ORX85199.1 hypothetical protein BCR32DRAFT_265840 [Anaeromyces robustus]
MPSAIIIGSTGANGINAINELLRCGLFDKVTSLARNTIDYKGPNNNRLVQKIVNFEDIKNYRDEFKGHTFMFSCFGTTRQTAENSELFHKYEYDYVLNSAKLFKEENKNKKLHYVLLSTSYSNSKSPVSYFMETKKDIEEGLKKMEFSKLSILRPGLLLNHDIIKYIIEDNHHKDEKNETNITKETKTDTTKVKSDLTELELIQKVIKEINK